MAYYYRPTTGQVQVIDDDLYAGWVAAGNPKAAAWQQINDPPGPSATWDGTQWITPEPVIRPDYIGFYDGLIASSVYQEIRAKAALFQPLLMSATEFLGAFGDAKAGRPNIGAIQMSVWGLIYWLQPSPAVLTALGDLLSTYNLAGTYTLQIPEIVLASFESQPNPFKFYQGILASNFYATKVRPALLTSESPIIVAVTAALGFAIKDSQSGLVPLPVKDAPPNGLQVALWDWMAAFQSLLSEEDIAEIQDILKAANLSDLYTLSP